MISFQPIPKKDPHHLDAIDLRPNPIVQLNKNLLLDALSTPTELAKSFGKKHKGAYKGSIKKMFAKNLIGSQTMEWPSNTSKGGIQLGLHTTFSHNRDDLDEPQSASLKSRKSKRSKTSKNNEKNGDASEEDDTKSKKSHKSRKSLAGSLKSRISVSLNRTARKAQEEEEHRPKP